MGSNPRKTKQKIIPVILFFKSLFDFNYLLEMKILLQGAFGLQDHFRSRGGSLKIKKTCRFRRFYSNYKTATLENVLLTHYDVKHPYQQQRPKLPELQLPPKLAKLLDFITWERPRSLTLLCGWLCTNAKPLKGPTNCLHYSYETARSGLKKPIWIESSRNKMKKSNLLLSIFGSGVTHRLRVVF